MPPRGTGRRLAATDPSDSPPLLWLMRACSTSPGRQIRRTRPVPPKGDQYARKLRHASTKRPRAAGPEKGGSVRENILFRPAREIEGGADGKEGEAGPGELHPALALQHVVEHRLDVVQVEHVGGGIGELRLRKIARAPVRTLLLLGKVDVHDFPGEILEAVAVGIGAHELRGDLGAVDGRGDDAEITLDHRDVETREMENLENVLVRHQRAQV